MAGKKTMDAATKLDAVRKALRREVQLKNALKELADKIDVLERQKQGVRKELDALKETLDDDRKLTAVAREMMADALKLQGAGDGDFAVYNPAYVTNEDKATLLEKILADYAAENPRIKGMPFSTIKSVLANRYKIDTSSAGLFFRNQLGEYETEGGNRNKKVVLGSRDQS